MELETTVRLARELSRTLYENQIENEFATWVSQVRATKDDTPPAVPLVIRTTFDRLPDNSWPTRDQSLFYQMGLDEIVGDEAIRGMERVLRLSGNERVRAAVAEQKEFLECFQALKSIHKAASTLFHELKASSLRGLEFRFSTRDELRDLVDELRALADALRDFQRVHGESGPIKVNAVHRESPVQLVVEFASSAPALMLAFVIFAQRIAAARKTYHEGSVKLEEARKLRQDRLVEALEIARENNRESDAQLIVAQLLSTASSNENENEAQQLAHKALKYFEKYFDRGGTVHLIEPPTDEVSRAGTQLDEEQRALDRLVEMHPHLLTVERTSINEAEDSEFLEVDGIGNATLRKIRGILPVASRSDFRARAAGIVQEDIITKLLAEFDFPTTWRDAEDDLL